MNHFEAIPFHDSDIQRCIRILQNKKALKQQHIRNMNFRIHQLKNINFASTPNREDIIRDIRISIRQNEYFIEKIDQVINILNLLS